MAKKDKAKELKQKSRFAAMEALRPVGGPPVAPRKAMKDARKASKGLSYPVPPYPGAGPVQVYRWAQHEWWRLGKWQSLAMPFAILSALLTWEKEMTLRQRRAEQLDRADIKEMARAMYLAPPRKPKRKLFGVIPLPGKR
jgi:hypothetical protein